MKYKKYIRLMSFILMLITVFLSLPIVTNAATPIDSSGAYADLVNMKTDLTAYKKNEEDKQAKVMEFLEFCYDANGNQNDYGLYLYVYNPSCEPITVSGGYSAYNTIQLGICDANGNAKLLQTKYKLIFLNHSTESDGKGLAHLYYKFKIDVPKNKILKGLSSAKRVYKVVDLELMYSGEYNPRKTNVSNTYSCRGYMPYHAAGGNNIKSTYYCFAETLETIEIELGQTSWKSVSSDKGVNNQYEVSSVYFAIPDYYLEKYGNLADPKFKGLHDVSMEWYEYKINGLITDNSALYSSAKKILGKTLPTSGAQNYNVSFANGDFYQYVVFDNSVPFSFFETQDWFELGIIGRPEVAFNCNLSLLIEDRYINGLCNAIYSVGGAEKVSTEELMKSIYSNEPFYIYGDVDTGRKKGKNSDTISVEDGKLNDLIHSFAVADKTLWNYLDGEFFSPKDKYGYGDIEPIRMLSDKDLSLIYSDESIAESLFMNEGDVDSLRAFYNSAKDDKKTTYLLRFAVTDYYFTNVVVMENDEDIGLAASGNHYYFEKTIFHNFDVLSFTFKDAAGRYTTVPVSCKPISVVGNITIIDPKDKNIGGKLIGDGNKDFSDLSAWAKVGILILGFIVILLIISGAVKLFRFLFFDRSTYNLKKREVKLKEKEYQDKKDKEDKKE